MISTIDAKPLRVCAYCRVSTENEEQACSLSSQEDFFRQYISTCRSWEFAGIYADRGASGTATSGRPEFLRMLSDAEALRFDRIVTKEVSRFARNTVDALVTVRRLRELGIGVTFLNDGIDTLAPEGELRLTILCSVAQEESRRTSERVRWGQKRRMEQGVVFGRDMLGYTVSGGKMIVNDQEAAAVRYIFYLYVSEGLGFRSIAARLNSENIPPKLAESWRPEAVRRVILNEKYTGDLIQGKTVTRDHLSHKRFPNPDPAALTVIEQHHEPIIPRELFERAQQSRTERVRRAESSRYSARYWCSGKVICGKCGCRYVSRSKRYNGRILRSWRCSAACGNTSLPDEALRQAAILTAGYQLSERELAESTERITALDGSTVRIKLRELPERTALITRQRGRCCIVSVI